MPVAQLQELALYHLCGVTVARYEDVRCAVQDSFQDQVLYAVDEILIQGMCSEKRVILDVVVNQLPVFLRKTDSGGGIHIISHRITARCVVG